MRIGNAKSMTTSENVMHSTDELVTLSEDIRPKKEREGTLVPSFRRNIALNLYVIYIRPDQMNLLLHEFLFLEKFGLSKR